MQAYGKGFARIYDIRWSAFARQIAPLIHDFYAASPIGQTNLSLLDLCCGTGQLAQHFLQKGYRVVGIDLSEPMLGYARDNNRDYVESGRAEFIHGDVSDFTLDDRFGLVVSTFDALNHLEDVKALRNCFQCVHAVSDGLFIFDLNTRLGLKRWNSINVDESSDDSLLITRGLYDGQSDKAWTKITGFVRARDGLFERFDETTFNTVFDLDFVKTALMDTGWQDVYFARGRDLQTPLSDPEAEARVFVVARCR